MDVIRSAPAKRQIHRSAETPLRSKSPIPKGAQIEIRGRDEIAQNNIGAAPLVYAFAERQQFRRVRSDRLFLHFDGIGQSSSVPAGLLVGDYDHDVRHEVI